MCACGTVRPPFSCVEFCVCLKEIWPRLRLRVPSIFQKKFSCAAVKNLSILGTGWDGMGCRCGCGCGCGCECGADIYADVDADAGAGGYGMGSDGMGSDGMVWGSVGWDGMGWHGTVWDGTGWDGMRWDARLRCGRKVKPGGGGGGGGEGGVGLDGMGWERSGGWLLTWGCWLGTCHARNARRSRG